jgi:hypothetical protein
MRRSSALAPGGPQAPVPSWVPQSEAAQQLLTTDPGTYRSIQDIANKASDAYGIPANEVSIILSAHVALITFVLWSTANPAAS